MSGSKADYDQHQGEGARVDRSGIMIGEWSTGVWSCFDSMVPNCCMVTFCPFISLAQIVSRMGLSTYSKALLFYLTLYITLGVCNALADKSMVLCIGGCVVYLLYSYSNWKLRVNVRERFSIPGSACNDLLLVCCCSCCTIAQMATHTKSYKPGSCEFGPVDTLPAFNQQ